MDLSLKDFAILLAMERNPQVTIQEMSRMLGLSRYTIREHLKKLKDSEKGIIKKSRAYVYPERLGLKRLYTIFYVSNEQQLGFLRELCDKHPYTNYYVPIIGGNFGMLSIFDVPPSTIDLMKELFEYIERETEIECVGVFPSTGLRSYSLMNLTKYNIEMAKWDFSWKEWFGDLNSYEDSITYPENDQSKKLLKKIKPTHLRLLQQLTTNADFKQSEFMVKYNLSKAEASRQYNLVKNNFVSIFVLTYDRSIFDIVETDLVIGTTTKEKIARLYNKFNENPPPFQMTLDISENNQFLFWGRLPPTQSMEFAFELWNYCDKASVFRLDVKNSFSYYFYPENFDFKKKDWKKTKEYLVAKPIKELKQYIEQKSKIKV